MSKTSAEITSTKQLFAYTQFRVPAYQRAFAWGDKQVTDLWEDLVSGADRGQEHHFGTIVLKQVPSDSSTEFSRTYEVVDGQQRITAVVLLVLALIETATAARDKERLQGTFVGSIAEPRLVLGSLNGDFLPKLVKKVLEGASVGNPSVPTNRRLRDALEKLEHFARLKKNESAEEHRKVIQYLENELKVLKFVIHDDVAAIRMFQSLNDRGRPLSVLDRTKSHLMLACAERDPKWTLQPLQRRFEATYSAFDQVRKYAKDGKKDRVPYIAKQIREDELLRLQYHYHAQDVIDRFEVNSGKQDQAISYEYRPSIEMIFDHYVKDMCSHPALASKRKLFRFVTEYCSDLKDTSGALARLFRRAKKAPDSSLHQLLMWQQPSATVYPLLVALETSGRLDDGFIELIRVLDMRVYKLLRTGPKADLYREVISRAKNEDNKTSVLFNACQEFTKHFASNTIVVPILRGSIEHFDRSTTKYLLWQHERETHRHLPGSECPSSWDDLSRRSQVEHVLPRNTQSFKPGNGFPDLATYNEHAWMLGNLCILEGSLNKAAGNRSPKLKAKHYKASKYPGVRALGNELASKGFPKRALLKRRDEVAKFVKEHWKIPKKR